MKVSWCCRMVIALTKDEPNFLQHHLDPRNRKIILETLFSSWADYRLPFKACVLHHYNEIFFVMLRMGTHFVACTILFIVDHEYIKFFAERCCTFELWAIYYAYALYFCIFYTKIMLWKINLGLKGLMHLAIIASIVIRLWYQQIMRQN